MMHQIAAAKLGRNWGAICIKMMRDCYSKAAAKPHFFFVSFLFCAVNQADNTPLPPTSQAHAVSAQLKQPTPPLLSRPAPSTPVRFLPKLPSLTSAQPTPSQHARPTQPLALLADQPV
ncbi:hypothetical protein TIFTF001_020432 [Ficus carica]|uniref:Uncharacterized protein n=1 Tax=Ficus carica TaxID=3494 RepID=A0AA88A8K8_FICCA|nr:hypothetical protein TIFTF001_020432 [Ficus carica]